MSEDYTSLQKLCKLMVEEIIYLKGQIIELSGEKRVFDLEKLDIMGSREEKTNPRKVSDEISSGDRDHEYLGDMSKEAMIQSVRSYENYYYEGKIKMLKDLEKRSPQNYAIKKWKKRRRKYDAIKLILGNNI